jgi:hypothetical protein
VAPVVQRYHHHTQQHRRRSSPGPRYAASPSCDVRVRALPYGGFGLTVCSADELELVPVRSAGGGRPPIAPLPPPPPMEAYYGSDSGNASNGRNNNGAHYYAPASTTTTRRTYPDPRYVRPPSESGRSGWRTL